MTEPHANKIFFGHICRFAQSNLISRVCSPVRTSQMSNQPVQIRESHENYAGNRGVLKETYRVLRPPAVTALASLCLCRHMAHLLCSEDSLGIVPKCISVRRHLMKLHSSTHKLATQLHRRALECCTCRRP